MVSVGETSVGIGDSAEWWRTECVDPEAENGHCVDYGLREGESTTDASLAFRYCLEDGIARSACRDLLKCASSEVMERFDASADCTDPRADGGRCGTYDDEVGPCDEVCAYDAIADLRIGDIWGDRLGGGVDG